MRFFDHLLGRAAASSSPRPSICALLACAGLAVASARADVTPDARMLRFPAVSDTQIAFVYAGSLWMVPKAGGMALPVAAPPGQVSFPRFSPDGKTIAFSANYDGNRDLYTLPVTGGVPQRVTYHPGAETLAGWINDERLLFFTNALGNMARQTQIFTVSASGGLPEKLPVPYGAFGSMSPDGKLLAYTPHTTDSRTWKRYVGGMATDVWMVNLTDGSSKRLTDWKGTDTLPMFSPDGKTIYFLSDSGSEHRLNVWSYDVASGAKSQVTSFPDDDVRWPNMGGAPGSAGQIVFQLGSKLMLLDLASKQSSEIKVTIPGARPKVRSRNVDAGENITAFGLSPSGKRVLLTARGDIWSVPSKEGPARNLSNTDGEFERDATWSPDAKWIAYFSDKSGEYELWVRPSDAKAAEDEKKDADDKGDKDKKDAEASDGATKAEPKVSAPVKLTALGEGFRFGIMWSPDSKRVAYLDQNGNIRITTISADGDTLKGETVVVDKDPWMEPSAMSWSHDSNWLAYTRGDEGNSQNAIWLYKVAGENAGQKRQITSPMFDAGSPAFDRKGEFLYYRVANRFNSPKYSDVDLSFIYAGTRQLMAVALREDVKNPFAPRSDEEELKKETPKPSDKAKDEKKDEKKDAPAGEKKDDGDKKSDDTKGDKPEAKKDDKKDDKKKEVKIDLDGIEQRSFMLPVASGDFSNLLVADGDKLVYVRRGIRGDDEGPGRGGIKIFDPKAFVSDDKKGEETVLDGPGSFDISANGKKLFARVQGKLKLFDPAAGGGKPVDVAASGLRMEVDPRTEWKQIFADAWRLQRDYFYIDNMHGVDWPKMRDHYGKMIEDAASREDVQYIIGELISELNIGHAYVQSPGDVGDQGPSLSVGLLGVDYDLVGEPGKPGSAYRIKYVYEGAPWDADARSPLATVEAKRRPKVGDYLLAVNGMPVDTSRDPWAAFIGLADKPTTITVNDSPSMDGARDVLVRPIGNEASLRYRAWIERNRAYVEKKSGGKVGYIHVPDTGVNGQNELFRQFYGQRDKAALLIDERWNGGGQIPSRFIELLNRPVTNYWAKRDGIDWTWPPDSHQGPKAMLANGLSGSGGDMFPWLFKHHKVGKLFGTRTWGGLVGISGNPEFIDGGSMTVPTFGFYNTDGTWGVEGHGVDPDVVVIDDPALMMDNFGPEGPHAAVVGKFGQTGKGGDPQLDAAIEHLLKEVQNNPYVKPKRPQAPNRSGMGIPESDW